MTLFVVRWAPLGFIFFLIIQPAPANARAHYSVLARLTSNYVYQGYSKSSGNPAAQGNIDIQFDSGFFLGTWISQVDFDDGSVNDRADIEANPYVGWNRQISDDWSFDASLLGYIYDGEVYYHRADYGELSGQLHFRDLVTGRISVSPDAYGSHTLLQDYELQGRFPVLNALDVSASVGYSDGNSLLSYDYVYWNFGASWFLRRYAAIDLRYYDTRQLNEAAEDSAHNGIDLPAIKNHWVVSLNLGF